jgi:hypothetical protein
MNAEPFYYGNRWALRLVPTTDIERSALTALYDQTRDFPLRPISASFENGELRNLVIGKNEIEQASPAHPGQDRSGDR